MAFPLKCILCPTDFSAASTHAFHYALAVGAWFNAQIVVVHVHPLRLPVASLVAAGRGEPLQPLTSSEDERDRLVENLRVFVGMEAPGRHDVTWHLDESTDVSDAISKRATALQAELIVVGTHGRSGVRRHLVGSVAERVMRTAPCAVLAVPPHAPRIPGTMPRIERVICAVDFSPPSEHALECASAVAGRAGARLTVAHIVELPPDIPDVPHADLTGYRRARFEQARRQLQELLSGHLLNHLRVDELLLAGRPGPELLRLASEQQTDLMVMGVQGRHAAGVLLFGSVTNHVLREAACPVLTVRV